MNKSSLEIRTSLIRNGTIIFTPASTARRPFPFPRQAAGDNTTGTFGGGLFVQQENFARRTSE
jgi:hypothetical protein